PTPAVPNAGVGIDGRGTTELQQDVHRVAAELARTADQVSQQRSGAVQTMGGLSTTIAQAQAADARLKPLVHQAIVLAERIRAENSTRAKEEARFTRMAATSRAVMTKVRTIFEDLKRAATKAQRVEKRAQMTGARSRRQHVPDLGVERHEPNRVLLLHDEVRQCGGDVTTVVDL
ncbi:MAG: hypothetical protein IH897_16895, partial [Planctomycetes bacterium]|nr:hypothetical protein [Planctomycetota bacterium]